MLIIPAIDLKEGKCVRLKQGVMEDATVFSEDPGGMAAHWARQGARRLHVVDLNGAAAGKPKNESAIKAIVAALRERNIPAVVSQTAGTFVCNHVFYGLMHALRRQRSIRGGFIHMPYLPEQAPPGQPSLPRETMIEAIAVAIEVTLTTRADRREAGGRTH